MDPDKLKRFLPEGTYSQNSSLEKIRSRKMDLAMSGLEVKAMYEEILQLPESEKPTTSKTEIWVSRKNNPPESFSKSDLFRSFQDPERISQILTACPELVNETDQYNWTVLMMAACDGHSDSVQLLLELGADKDFDDGKGNSALALAQKKGHHEVVGVLESFGVYESDSEEEGNEPFWCKLCNDEIREADRKSHEASTVHQFNTKSAVEGRSTSFGIPSSNRGYQLMMKQGWNASTGLGPEQQGRKYPVKTVLRKHRQGLGIKQKSARVSHFAPHDMEAVKYKEPPKIKTRKDMLRERVKNRRLEHRLRRELS